MEDLRSLVQTESLDPVDWHEIRRLAHQMVDDMLDYTQEVGQREVWKQTPDDVVQSFTQPAPTEPQGANETYKEFKKKILPYPLGNIHPRFWGWYMGTGTFTGALADFLASIMNPNLAGGNHVANHVEHQVIRWLVELVGFPKDASGLLVSGGSMANFVGLAVARNAKAGFDIRQKGLQRAVQPMVLYGSSETHSCIQKAVELLGLGNQYYRRIPVDDRYRIDLNELEKEIAADKAAGLKPFCVIGNAGTVNTGSIDDLSTLADICQREGMWFHVDGAIGALVALASKSHLLIDGIQRADSVAMDLHKWLHVPFEAGVALIRHEEQHLNTFSLTPAYLSHSERGMAGGSRWFSDYGLQLSRNFRALKVWFTINEHGTKKFGRLIDQNIEQAFYLEKLVHQAPELEMMAPVTLNIVCFRYNPGGMDTGVLNELNQELLIRLHESGLAAPSYTTLQESYCIRAAIANHRTQPEDIELLVREVVRLGDLLVAEKNF